MAEEDNGKPTLERHEEEIKLLRDRAHKVANDLMKANLTAVETAASLQKELTEIRGHTHRLSEKIPDDISVRLVRLELKLDALTASHASDFVKRGEWEVLRSEHDQMKRLIYGFVSVILLSVIGALVALVLKR